MNAKHAEDATPFVRDVATADIPPGGIERKWTANEAERRALAVLAGIPAVERFEVAVRIVPQGERFHVTGEIAADIVQICVVSLEAFPSRLAEPIDVGYASPSRIAADAARLAEEAEEGVSDSLDVDPDEPILSDGAANERLDIGRLAAELFILGLDPHPRRPGAEFQRSVTEESRISPFAQLAALKGGDKSGNK